MSKNKGILIAGVILIGGTLAFLMTRNKVNGQGSTKGTLDVKSTPDGADILINGVSAGKATPSLINMDPGEYQLTLSKDGYDSYSTSFTIVSNAKTIVNAIMTAVEVGPGNLIIGSTPNGAQIFIDGIDTGDVTPQLLSLSPGNYNITLKLSGYEDYSESKTVATGSTVNLVATLTSIAPVNHTFSIKGINLPAEANYWVAAIGDSVGNIYQRPNTDVVSGEGESESFQVPENTLSLLTLYIAVMKSVSASGGGLSMVGVASYTVPLSAAFGVEYTFDLSIGQLA